MVTGTNRIFLKIIISLFMWFLPSEQQNKPDETLAWPYSKTPYQILAQSFLRWKEMLCGIFEFFFLATIPAK